MLAALGLLLLASAAGARTLGWKVFAHSVASGQNPRAAVFGATAHPKAIRFKISGPARRPVSGSWTLNCRLGTQVAVKGGSMSGRAPLTRLLPLPLAAPDKCAISAYAKLAGSGTVKITVSAR